jgi:hypothetical protein
MFDVRGQRTNFTPKAPQLTFDTHQAHTTKQPSSASLTRVLRAPLPSGCCQLRYQTFAASTVHWKRLAGSKHPMAARCVRATRKILATLRQRTAAHTNPQFVVFDKDCSENVLRSFVSLAHHSLRYSENEREAKHVKPPSTTNTT